MSGDVTITVTLPRRFVMLAALVAAFVFLAPVIANEARSHEPYSGKTDPVTKGGCCDLYLAEDTLYEVQLESFGATADYPGSLILTVNGTVISQVVEVNDPTATTPANIRLGMVESSLGIPFQAYFGDVDLGAATVLDFGSGHTGVDVIDGKTITTVGGKVMSIV